MLIRMRPLEEVENIIYVWFTFLIYLKYLLLDQTKLFVSSGSKAFVTSKFFFYVLAFVHFLRRLSHFCDASWNEKKTLLEMLIPNGISMFVLSQVMENLIDVHSNRNHF